MRISVAFFYAFFIMAMGACMASGCGLGKELGFKAKEPRLFNSPAEWLWHFDGSIEALRVDCALTAKEMFYLAHKYAQIGYHRRFEETLLYTLDKTDGVIAKLSAKALLSYWQTNKLYDLIASYGPVWTQRFKDPDFQLALVQAYYWQNNNQLAWDLLEEVEELAKLRLGDEYYLLRTVLALRLAKVVELKDSFRQLICGIPACPLHQRLWDYLQGCVQERKLLEPEMLSWLEFKNLVWLAKGARTLTQLTVLLKGNYKDWFLSSALISDFVGLYTKKDAQKGLALVQLNFSNDTSPYLSQARASLLAKQEKWSLASSEYKQGLVATKDLELDKTSSYYYAYLRCLTYLSLEDFLEGLSAVSEEFLKSRPFERLFDVYLNELVEGRQWQDIYELYVATRKFLSCNYLSRMAFLMARLVEHSLVHIVGDPKEQKAYFYEQAMQADPLSYGSFMSYYFTGNKFTNLLNIRNCEVSWEIDEELNRIFTGFLEFGLAREAYAFFKQENSLLSATNYLCLAQLLAYQGYWFDSIEVMTRLAKRKNWCLSLEELKVLYPQPFVSSIRYWANNYGISFLVRMGQIHEESRFDPLIKSAKEAKGISQLLETTAQQIARELNVYRYSLSNPEDNIRFGTYYLAKRFKQYGSGMKALLAYNAGYFRVEEWDKQLKDLPQELYLEGVPFWETRRYVRSVVLNAGVYALLYGKEGDFERQVIKRIFNF